ncbi:hypothetical protein NDU88_000271 [Pleurodeles waltl]|uniref:Uncharacterized protein n=1 Tax=Pleurodeles waltl TaxID=8319 RepID=A0AAV7L9N9_PLEWA|nr:hypothetical protein NDU88_000271 [Pleurodeles waltl]
MTSHNRAMTSHNTDHTDRPWAATGRSPGRLGPSSKPRDSSTGPPGSAWAGIVLVTQPEVTNHGRKRAAAVVWRFSHAHAQSCSSFRPFTARYLRATADFSSRRTVDYEYFSSVKQNR